MKICLAQTRPVKGDIEANLDQHRLLVSQALSYATDLIIFPELSLTGYEPTFAGELATDMNDARFDLLQTMADDHQVSIGVGIPLRTDRGICIGTLLFRPHLSRHAHLKKYLHPDEEEFFVGGLSSSSLLTEKPLIGLAICYEISVKAHAAQAVAEGAEYYLASVAKFKKGIYKAHKRLSEIARSYAIPVLMVNCVGQCDGDICAGKSAVWDRQGKLIGQLDGENAGLLVFDTEKGEIVGTEHFQ